MTNHKTFDWETIRKDFEKSDLSIGAFSRLNGFSATTGRKHLNDITARKCQNQAMAQIDSNSEAEKTDFVALELSEPDLNNIEVPEVTFVRTPVDEEEKKSGVPIDLKIDNVTVTLHSGFEKNDLRTILEVVRELC